MIAFTIKICKILVIIGPHLKHANAELASTFNYAVLILALIHKYLRINLPTEHDSNGIIISLDKTS